MKAWKIQKLLGDVVYDLRSRGLLPVAALLVIAMLAVPVLILGPGSGSGGGAAGSAGESAAELAPENQPAVLAYNPGVRDYKERLDALASKDPFVQQFTAPEVGTTSLEQSGISTETGSQTSTEGGSSGGESTSGSGTSVTSETKSKPRYFHYVTDVKVGEAGTKLKKHRAVDPFDYLPSEELPVAVFLGNQTKQDAVFLVSKDVAGVEGDGKCFPAPDACQLLTVKLGQAAELAYGPDSKRYRIKVVRIELKASRKPPKR